MISETFVVKSNSFDPYWNLAIEEYLLNQVKTDQCILFLWQNSNSIVIGKHQNPWKECRTDLLGTEGIKLARRLSGGGAVFHDDGNINFTFLLTRENYNLPRQEQVIVNAVKLFGIDAEINGRNDLTVKGRKFSGNAFCFKRINAYHHGTILVSADMAKLSRYLQPSKEKIFSKGIDSVRSRVVNLREFCADITVEDMGRALIAAFAAEYGTAPQVITGDDWLEQDTLNVLYKKYKSWYWRYGKTPQFTINFGTRFPWGGIEFGLNMKDGIIEDAVVYSDALDVEFIEMFPDVFKAAEFHSRQIANKIRALTLNGTQKIMVEDIALWLETSGF